MCTKRWLGQHQADDKHVFIKKEDESWTMNPPKYSIPHISEHQ